MRIINDTLMAIIIIDKIFVKWPSPELQNISMLGKYVSEKLLMHYKLPYFLIDSHVFSYFPHSGPSLSWTSNSKVENEARTFPWNKILKPTMGMLMRLKGCPPIFFKKLSFWSFKFSFTWYSDIGMMWVINHVHRCWLKLKVSD